MCLNKHQNTFNKELCCVQRDTRTGQNVWFKKKDKIFFKMLYLVALSTKAISIINYEHIHNLS